MVIYEIFFVIIFSVVTIFQLPAFAGSFNSDDAHVAVVSEVIRVEAVN